MLLIVPESFSRVPKNIWNLVRIIQTLRQCRSASYGGKVAWRVHRLQPSAFDFPDAALEILPVANDSCGGSAAVVNYRNWPN